MFAVHTAELRVIHRVLPVAVVVAVLVENMMGTLVGAQVLKIHFEVVLANMMSWLQNYFAL